MKQAEELERAGRQAGMHGRKIVSVPGLRARRRNIRIVLPILAGVFATLLVAKADFAGVIFLNSTPTGVLTVPSQSYAEL